MNCPRCASALKPVVHDGQEIEVCSGCKGEWLSSEELGNIVERHDEIFTPDETASIQEVSRATFRAEKDDHYELACPSCGEEMELLNYGETSGVVIHKCVECDGVWMDKEQLGKIETVVDGWKDALKEDSDEYGSIIKKVKAQEEAESARNVSISKISFVNAILRRFCD